MVLPDNAVETTRSGIVLPDYVKKRQNTGVVLSVGSKVKELKAGDRVLHGEFSINSFAQRWTIDDKEIFIIREEHILAKIT